MAQLEKSFMKNKLLNNVDGKFLLHFILCTTLKVSSLENTGINIKCTIVEMQQTFTQFYQKLYFTDHLLLYKYIQNVAEYIEQIFGNVNVVHFLFFQVYNEIYATVLQELHKNVSCFIKCNMKINTLKWFLRIKVVTSFFSVFYFHC